MAEKRTSDEIENAEERVEEIAEKIAVGGVRVWRRDQYVFVFVLIIATLLSTAFLGDGPLGVLFTLVLMVGTLFVALNTSGAGRRFQLLAILVGVLAIVLIFIAQATHQIAAARIAYAVTMIVLVTATPWVIARRIMQHVRINLETITGAADIYLLIGLFFTTVYGLMGLQVAKFGQNAAQGFLVASRPVSPGDLVYFSFTTLTTVGYGDLTAATPLGRMLAVTEALVGQLYLVTVVAVLVSNMGRTRQQRADGSAEPLVEREN